MRVDGLGTVVLDLARTKKGRRRRETKQSFGRVADGHPTQRIHHWEAKKRPMQPEKTDISTPNTSENLQCNVDVETEGLVLASLWQHA